MSENKNDIFDKLSDLLVELLKIENINEKYPKLDEGYYVSTKKGDKLIYLKLKIKEIKLNVQE